MGTSTTAHPQTVPGPPSAEAERAFGAAGGSYGRATLPASKKSAGNEKASAIRLALKSARIAVHDCGHAGHGQYLVHRDHQAASCSDLYGNGGNHFHAAVFSKLLFCHDELLDEDKQWSPCCPP